MASSSRAQASALLSPWADLPKTEVVQRGQRELRRMGTTYLCLCLCLFTRAVVDLEFHAFFNYDLQKLRKVNFFCLLTIKPSFSWFKL